jgi:hypothetical protein
MTAKARNLRHDCQKVMGVHAMPNFDPELVKVMRSVLEEIMTRVPLEYSTAATEAYHAEGILKAAAQGRTSYDELVAAAADQLPAVLSLFI